MRKIPIVFLIPTFFTLFLSGCSFFATAVPTPTFPPAIGSTVTAPLPTPLNAAPELPSTTPSVAPQAISTAITPLTAAAGVDNLVLRNGPGILFENLGVFAENSKLTVMGKSQGGGWYFVVTQNNAAGWMKSDFVTLAGDATSLPYFAYSDANLVTGHISAPDGSPASGIGVSIAPVGNDLGASYDATVTDTRGTFYLYLPTDQTGNFQVGPNGYTCEGNLIVGKCELPFQMPDAQTVTLPMENGVLLEFSLVNR